MDFYFSRFEHRRPPEPLKTPRWVMMTWQVLAVAALILGANYIYWRWTASLNTDALWYAIPLVLAETLAWIGTVLFTINLWKEQDPPQSPPPSEINDCLSPEEAVEPRPVKVDLFIATYSEDTELVRLSIRDAMKMDYPYPIDYRIHVLDDGRRPEMKAMRKASITSVARPTSDLRPVTCAMVLSKPTAIFLLSATPIPVYFPPFSAIRWAISATLTWPGCRRRSGSSISRKEKVCRAGVSGKPEKWAMAWAG